MKEFKPLEFPKTNLTENEAFISPKSAQRKQLSPKHRDTLTTLIPSLKKFIYMCKKNTEFFKYHALTQNSFSLINDITVFPTERDSKLVLFYLNVC